MQNNTENNNHITNQDISDLCAVFAKQIDKIVEQRIAKAEFDKTYYGLISAVYFDNNTDKTSKEYQMYQISYNGYTQDVYIRDGIMHSRGDKIKITLPNGKYKDRYIEVLTQNDNPINIELASDGNKIIKTQTDGTGKKTIVNEYNIIRDSDGNITQVIFPSGRIMNVKGF